MSFYFFLLTFLNPFLAIWFFEDFLELSLKIPSVLKTLIFWMLQYFYHRHLAFTKERLLPNLCKL